jgi:hypothetical protein
MKRILGIALLWAAILLPLGMALAQEVIDVSVQGISDGQRDSKQRDRDEAIMDAKLNAVEKAGVSIKSVTEVENFQLKKDWIESQADAYLLPGFSIIEIGYGEDGLYHVVLTGKVSTQGITPVQEDTDEEIPVTYDEGDRLYNYALSLQDTDPRRSVVIMLEVVDKYPESESADDALWFILRYSFLQYGEIASVNRLYTRLQTQYPRSPYIAKYQVLRKDSQQRGVMQKDLGTPQSEYERRKLLEQQHKASRKKKSEVHLK